jgi:serine/threonine protein kinase
MLEILKFEKPPKIPEDLSSEAKSFLEKCLKINPKERWNVNKLKAHPWIQAVKVKKYNNFF